MMRAITVQQPFAWAIAERYKPVENRGQNVRYRGEVAIHAGLPISDALLPDWGARVILHRRGGLAGFWDARSVPSPRPANLRATMARGAVIAVAQLVDCHPAVTRRAQTCCRPWGQVVHGTAGRPAHHLVLEDVRPLAEPVPCSGMQAVPWPIKDEAVVAAIRAQLEGVTVGG